MVRSRQLEGLWVEFPNKVKLPFPGLASAGSVIIKYKKIMPDY